MVCLHSLESLLYTVNGVWQLLRLPLWTALDKELQGHIAALASAALGLMRSVVEAHLLAGGGGDKEEATKTERRIRHLIEAVVWPSLSSLLSPNELVMAFSYTELYLQWSGWSTITQRCLSFELCPFYPF